MTLEIGVMNKDMTVACDNGLINIRVGAIILHPENTVKHIISDERKKV